MKEMKGMAFDAIVGILVTVIGMAMEIFLFKSAVPITPLTVVRSFAIGFLAAAIGRRIAKGLRIVIQ